MPTKWKTVRENFTQNVQNNSKRVRPNFVALDGESINDKYVLLGTSVDGKCLENENGITTLEALKFLCNLGSNRHYVARHSVFVSFYFSYDIEMILRDLPKRQKLYLFKLGKCDYRGYTLRYYRRKFFTVKKKGKEKLHDGKATRVGQNGITVYDACGFFTGQGGFIKVLQSFGIKVPDEIIKGKENRSKFTWKDYTEIKKYNQLECVLLVELMNKIYDLLLKVDLIPRKWYGSSALANLALRKWGINEYSRRTDVDNTPEQFFDVITRAYFGGRIEAFSLGSFSNVYAYDVNSAYPSAMVHLPPTKGNYWIETDKYIEKAFGVWRVSYNFPASERIGYFPYRMRDGSIKFPLRGEGYYWTPEVNLARKVYPKCVQVTHGYILLDDEDRTPLAEYVPRLYNERKKYKAANDLCHWVLKIILNSLYGKFAQKVGRADFKNFCYAGYITSHTRAQLRAAVVGKEKSIIAFNTDGIFSECKLPIKNISDCLGDWELKRYKKLSVIMSGLYLADDGSKVSIKNRGYAGLPEWKDLVKELNKRGKVSVSVDTFVGFLLAFNFPNEFGKHYLKFLTREKVINPHSPKKRKYFIKDIRDWNADSCDSLPIKRLDGLSYPIRLEQELTEEDLYELVED